MKSIETEGWSFQHNAVKGRDWLILHLERIVSQKRAVSFAQGHGPSGP